ncbi:hypothetical protein N7470_007095 [Penicillium chermesinum]|nr:hypothetical protein N7470_007095 [Penicillium chermesinum]
MMASSFSLSAGSLFLLSLAAPAAAASKYGLVETWQGENFLSYFNFHVGADPTNGYVNYLDQQDAESAGLVKVTDSGSVYLGVDHKTTLDPEGKGRDSVRIGTKKYYDKSLVVADVAHMPGSACGTWPAFWSVGKNWPSDGEIDIIEGVNLQEHNEIVMHTSGTCALGSAEGMTGAINATGCGEDLGPVGCVIEGDQGSYGTPFNKQGGGVYAMEWTSHGEPDPSEFGLPMALVQEGCDVANSFKAQSFIFDVTFCGDWAGGVFGESGCPLTGGDSFQSCTNYVANNPSAFEQSYWEINSVKVYELGAKGINPNPVHSSSHAATQIPAATSVSEAPAKAPHTTSEPAPAKNTVPAQETIAPGTVAAEPTTSKSGKTITVDTTSYNHITRTQRYVTEVVTSLTTICMESHSEPTPISVVAAQPSGAPVEPFSALPASHSSPSIAVETVVASSGSHVPCRSNGKPSSQAQPIPTSAAAINAPASPLPMTSEVAVTALPSKPVPVETAPVVSSASHVAAMPASSNGPQTSRPLIPAPTNNVAAAPSGSDYHSFQGSATSEMGPVFTGAADRVHAGASLFIAAMGLALVI